MRHILDVEIDCNTALKIPRDARVVLYPVLLSDSSKTDDVIAAFTRSWGNVKK